MFPVTRPDFVDGVHVEKRPLGPRELLNRTQSAYGFEHHIDVANLAVLRRIAAQCRQHGIQCLYAHGPIYAPFCDIAAGYLRKIDVMIEDAGLPVVLGTPPCVAADNLGDTEDHIRPALKIAYTRRYFDLLAPYIRPTLAKISTDRWLAEAPQT